MPLSYGRLRAPDRLHLIRLFVLGVSSASIAEAGASQPTAALQFQSGFLRQSPGHASNAGDLALNALARQNDLGAGIYRVDIKVNQAYFDQREIEFVLSPQGDRLLPCFSAELLGQMGVRLDTLAEPGLLQTRCVDLLALIPSAEVDFDGAQLSLAVAIPQIAMRRDAAGRIDPERWDHGINAAFVSYQASAQQGISRYRHRTNSDDLYLNSGINLGAWRLRSNQSLRRNDQGDREWSRAYTYAQRDLPGAYGNLTLGETFTRGDVFRSVPIKGLVVGSDLGMLPDVMQGYAPVIRGVAQTRAKLEILQSGYPIYSTYVSPGPYEIDDLSILGGSGELEIVLTEADGQVRRFTQSYATLSNLLRKGVWRYSGAMGRYNGADDLDEPLLWQGTLAMGTVWDSTLYGGLMASHFYQAGTVGVSRDLGLLGALAVDVTHSGADINTQNSQHVQGVSYALKYGKTFASSTNLRFAGYRYSTEGYRDFDEAVRQRSHSTTWYGSRRSRLEASISQKLSTRSSLSLSLAQQDYWQHDNKERQFQLNFNTYHQGVNYSLFATQSLSDTRDPGRQIGLSISLPLEFGHSTNVTFDLQKVGEGYSQRASLGGSADASRISYRASLSNDDGRQQSAALSVGYQAAFGSLGGGLTQGNDYRTLSVNASGAMLMHADGIELGPYLGETAALVEVPGIAGVGVLNATGVRTNSQGYALVPYLRPYRLNHMVLQTDELGPEVEIDNGTAQLVPRRGAVVKATFPARIVTRMLLTTRSASGLPLPFGAQVSDSEGAVIGVVGQAGQVLLSTSAEPKTLDVRWGDQVEPQCQLHIDPLAMEQSQGYRLQTLTCG